MRNLRYLIDHARTFQDSKGVKNLYCYYRFIQLNSDSTWESNRCDPALENCTVVYKDGKSLYNTTVGPVSFIFFDPLHILKFTFMFCCYFEHL